MSHTRRTPVRPDSTGFGHDLVASRDHTSLRRTARCVRVLVVADMFTTYALRLGSFMVEWYRVAFILSAGRFPAGSADLPRDAEQLKQITFEAKTP